MAEKKKVEGSAFLKAVKPSLKELLGILLDRYEYASILAVDSAAKIYSVTASGINLGDFGMLCNRGFVIKVFENGEYAEYSFNRLDADIKAQAEKIIAEIEALKKAVPDSIEKLKLRMLEDEPMEFVKSTEYEINPFELGAQSIVDKLTDLRKKGLDADKRLLDCCTRMSCRKYSKLFLSRNKDMEQNVLWTDCTMSFVARKDSEVKRYFASESNLGGAEVLDKLEEPEIKEIADILVMNDASSDNTNWIVKQRNHAVVTHIFNLGYGSALQLGYKYAIRRNYKYVIQMDADGQHDVCNILNIYKALKTKYNDSYPDIVLGSRYLKDSSPYKTSFLKELAYSIFRTFIKMSTGRTIMDPTTGLQGLSWRAVLYYSKYGNFDERYPDANMITGMILKGYNVVEIPAVMHSREFGKSMHSGLKPIWYMCHMTLSLIAVVVRQHKEKRRMERHKKHEQ